MSEPKHTPELVRAMAARLIGIAAKERGHEPGTLLDAADMLKDLLADNQRLRGYALSAERGAKS